MVTAGLGAEVVTYTLRHNFGSTLAAAKVEGYELMRAMGHKNIGTSMRYIHLANEGVQATTTRATDKLAASLGLAERPLATVMPIRKIGKS